MRLIHPDGSIDVGADAAYQIARRLPGWRRIAWLYRLPLLNPIARGAYALVAKYRYKLAARCDDGVCKAP
jgi:predicted DCC family thiol-disulfide oxidoreductase YuxK